MKTTIALPHAPTTPLPDLAAFLAPLRVHFQRSEGYHSLERYLTGLLTEHPNKNCDTLAHIVPATNQQRLHNLLTDLAWDEEELNRQRVQRLLTLPSEGDGVLIFDDTGFAKQGRASVGVARQYAGTLGKKANCQITVNCHYAERTIAWPVATRLYLPAAWANDPDRRQRAHVPPEIVFQTKPQLALALLDQAQQWGVSWTCVVADADYGDNPNFLDGLQDRHQRYVVAVRRDFTVAVPRRGGAGQRAEAVVAAQSASAWRTVRWREGSQGWLQGRFVAVRCWRQNDGRRRAGWLLGEQVQDGAKVKLKYHWSNFRPRATLATMVEYAHRRHWVEQYHEEAKGLLGWDQYQGRRWDGFHRNAVCVQLAYSFLVWQEWQQRPERHRRGRPRRAFSPSAGPTAAVVTGDPSADQPVAALASRPGVAAA